MISGSMRNAVIVFGDMLNCIDTSIHVVKCLHGGLEGCYLMRMAGSVIVSLFVLLAVGCQQGPPVDTADGELWTAAVEQVRRGLPVQEAGGLAIVNQTIPTADLHGVPSAPIREQRLLDLLRERNQSTRKTITGIRLPPRTRLIDANSVQSWEATKFPGEKLVSFSLPAILEDAT